MSQRLRISSLIAASLLIMGLGFQNCSKELPVEATSAASSNIAPASTNASVFKPKLRIGSAKQNADVSSLGTNWKTIPGATVTFELKEPLTADLRANGSATLTGGAAYAYTHCGFRFLVDGAPSGQASWGDVIAYVSNHTPWSITRDVELAAGPHTISVQMTGWNGADSTCVVSSQDYGAARLIVEGF